MGGYLGRHALHVALLRLQVGARATATQAGVASRPKNDNADRLHRRSERRLDAVDERRR